MHKAADLAAPEPGTTSMEEATPSTGGFRHTVATTTSDSFAVYVRAGQLSWILDEPESMGGQGTAPDPVTSFLGALCSCLLISLQITAQARQIPIAGASVSAKTNEKGFVKTIAVDLTVRSSAPEEKVRTVVERAEKGCYIKGLLKESIEYRLNLTVVPVSHRFEREGS
jgi:uncharacterized OsmC-like protein